MFAYLTRFNDLILAWIWISAANDVKSVENVLSSHQKVALETAGKVPDFSLQSKLTLIESIFGAQRFEKTVS